MDRIAVCIPCWNEAGTIGKVVQDFHAALPEAVIYVYDNNSTDGTDEIARKAGAVVRYEHAQGKGNVIRRMFREIDAACIIMTDGDATYPADCAKEMADLVLFRQADMVVGDRLSSTYFQENKRPFHNFGNSLVRRVINLMFGSEIRDILTGYRAFSYDFVKSFPVLSRGFEIETEMTIFAIVNNMQIEHVPVHYQDRPAGSVSKLNTFSDGLKVLLTIFRMLRSDRPMRFFGALGLVLLLLAIGFFIPVLHTYLVTGLVPNFPTLIVCGFAAIAGLQSIFSGLILQVLVNRERRDFEGNLHRIRADREIRQMLEKLNGKEG